MSPEPLPDDFSKILFHGDIVNNGICLSVEFHGRRPSSLLGVESQRNDWVDASSQNKIIYFKFIALKRHFQQCIRRHTFSFEILKFSSLPSFLATLSWKFYLLKRSPLQFIENLFHHFQKQNSEIGGRDIGLLPDPVYVTGIQI